MRIIATYLLIATLTACAAHAVSPVKEIDLASDTAWTLSIDGGKKRPIKVPGGGWNSELQSPRIASFDGVDDHIIYEREIEVPQVMANQVTKILFGAVNYGADVFIDGNLVDSIALPYVPFDVDISRYVTPGNKHQLKVKAYHRRHYTVPMDKPHYGKGYAATVPVGFDFPEGMPLTWAAWGQGSTKFAYGITASIGLAIYPPVYIQDVFVKPSVSKDALAAIVWVHNSTENKVQISVSSKLSSYNYPFNDRWKYPVIPEKTATIGPGATKEVDLQSVTWGLGPDSYWWPNIPFDEDYQAMLHYLHLDLNMAGKVSHSHRQRFGFVEYTEGKYYYKVNGIRVTYFSDSISYGQVGEYDCWSQTPCFLPPKGEFKGCPETWKRYQRIGFNTIRLSTSVPTPYMLKTADEAGFMLRPEGGCWGNYTAIFHEKRFPEQLQGMIRACRNHPCIQAYSLANEVRSDKGLQQSPWINLIDAAMKVDDTRPLSFDNGHSGIIKGKERGHAYGFRHYGPIAEAIEYSKTYGLPAFGEHCWGTDEMAQYAFLARDLRMKDWAYFAPWSWLNFWPNFLEGMSHERHPFRLNPGPNRFDGVNGWGSPLIKFMQKSLHPYLLVDHELRKKHSISAPKQLTVKVALLPERKLGDGTLPWPGYIPEYGQGTEIVRTIEVFNGGLSGNKMSLRWSAHWDTPGGPEAVKGGTVGPFEVEPGFHSTQTISFKAPEVNDQQRRLYLVLKSVKDGKVVFVEDAINFMVIW